MPFAEIDHAELLRQAQGLGTALAAGLLVGLERGWRDRELPEGGRVAGLRTFTLIGLLGGLLALSAGGSRLLPAAGLLAVAALFAVSFRQAAESAATLSITTAVAGLATFCLGLLAGGGHGAIAVGTAVVVALLLDLKPILHAWLRRIQRAELNAALQLGVLSAVVLPLLPDAGYGPYGALNPYRTWLAVVLISALSLLGHVAARSRGARQGLLWTGLLGGLASSTAATLALSRAARAQQRDAAAPAAAAIVAACGVMFLRMVVVLAALQPAQLRGLGILLLVLAAAAAAAAASLWRSGPNAPPGAGAPSGLRVFDLGTAIGFGIVLAVVAIVARAARDALGGGGLLAVAFVSGLADVDAILISSAQMQAQGDLGAATAATAILLAAVANMLAKAVMAWSIAGREVGRRVVGGYLSVAGAGAVAAAVLAH